MLAKNLKKFREEKGLSQKKIGELINISQQGYAKYEIGTATPDPERLSKISEILGVSIEQLLSNNEKKPVHVDEQKRNTPSTNLSPEQAMLVTVFARASEEDKQVIWTLLDRYMTPAEKLDFINFYRNSNISWKIQK